MNEHDTWAWGCEIPSEERPNGDARDIFATCPVCEGATS